MASRRQIEEILILSLENNFITEQEFGVLYEANHSKNPIFPHGDYDRFDLDHLDEAEVFAEFRVQKWDIERLADALGLPESFICHQRTRANRIEGLCVVLKRLAYPCRYSDMIHRFGRAVPELSMITNIVEDFIYLNHRHRVTQWNQRLLSPEKLQTYAEAVRAKGSPLRNCFGFIDGTVRPISRPGQNQKVVYNGHKRVHALKFQSVTLPNGLIAHLFGPVEGRRHDAGILRDSHLLGELEGQAFSPTGEAMCLYGDPAYPHSIHLQGPFKEPHLTPAMKDFNSAMSSVRTSVEWVFGDVIGSFKFLDFKKNLKIGLSPVAKHYIVSAILRNALTCLYGNNTATYFGLDPPSLEEYFS